MCNRKGKPKEGKGRNVASANGSKGKKTKDRKLIYKKVDPRTTILYFSVVASKPDLGFL